MTDRDVVLARIRGALGGVDPDSQQEPPRGYRRASRDPASTRLAEFLQRVTDYRASARLVTSSTLRTAISDACRRRHVRTLVVAHDLPTDWLPEGLELLVDTPEEPLTPAQLEACDGVLSACALGIAQTGTIVLDGGPGQGRRALTLLPDYHLCVIRAEQIVGIVPDAIAALSPRPGNPPRPLTFVSGPSATSDIELTRVEGVHGPRTLDVLVVDDTIQS